MDHMVNMMSHCFLGCRSLGLYHSFTGRPSASSTPVSTLVLLVLYLWRLLNGWILLCCLVWFYFSFNWGTHFVSGDSWRFRLVGVLYLGVVILFWLSDWFGFDQWLSLDGLCCPESLSSLNSLTREEEDVQCPSLLLSVVSRCSIRIGRGCRDGEGGVECFLLVGVTHMGSPAVDTASHS